MNNVKNLNVSIKFLSVVAQLIGYLGQLQPRHVTNLVKLNGLPVNLNFGSNSDTLQVKRHRLRIVFESELTK